MSIKSHNNSPLYDIRIRYNGELITFNLRKELTITQETVNDEMKTQASKYGFCLLVHKGLVTKFEEAKMKRKKVYGRLYFKAKKLTLNNRPLSDDLCKAWVEKHSEYIAATEDCIKTKDDADKLFSCIRAFEQRKDLMQTISSNIRSEK